VLDGVHFGIWITLRSTGTVANNAPNQQSFSVRTRAEELYGMAIASTPVPPLPDPADLVGIDGATIHTQAYTNLPGNPPGLPSNTAPFAGSRSFHLELDLAAAPFDTTGTFGYDFFSLISTTIIGGGGNLEAAIQTFADIELMVDYNYHEVTQNPAPATLLLMSLGLLLMRRRLGT
jgi:hypothetical protein